MNSSTDILDKILKIVNDNIENGEVSSDKIDDELSALGMNSISFIQIIVSIEEAFNLEIPDEKLFIAEMGTVNKMLEVIMTQIKNDTDSRKSALK